MKAAVCLFDVGADTRENALRCIEEFRDKFQDWKVDVFECYESPDIAKNLLDAKWEKRRKEVAENCQYDVCIGLNSSCGSRIMAINALDVADQTLYFTDGYGDSFKTIIDITCFYGNALTFDRVAEFYQFKLNSKVGIEDTRKFYWYIKTWKISTICIDKESFRTQ